MTFVQNARIAIGITSLAGLTALGGVGAVTFAPATNAEPPAQDSDAVAELTNELPPGYTSENCQPTDLAPDERAALECGQNTQPDGPSHAWFVLYPDQQTLDAGFNYFATEDELSPCPGNLPSPGPWRYGASADNAGHIACGVFEGKPDLVWTQNTELLLGSIQGVSIESLYDYWANPNGND